MSSQTLTQILRLFDATKDTDHDLRFMALSDLDKIVSESPENFPSYNRTTLPYAEILIEALDDPHSEIQNQAVKCFVPLTSILREQDVLKVIERLVNGDSAQVSASKQAKTSATSSASSLIISSVHTMAIKTILDNLNVTQQAQGRLLTDSLLHRFCQYAFLLSKIDVIEILNHLIDNLGSFFTPDQLDSTSQTLVQVVFHAEHTISKAAVQGLGKLVKHVVLHDSQVRSIFNLTMEEFQATISKYHSSDDELFRLNSLKLSVFTAIFKTSNPHVVQILPQVIKIVFETAVDSSKSHPDADIDPDFDFDLNFKSDQVRDDALICLEAIIQNVPFDSVKPYSNQILATMNQLLKYDPFNTNGLALLVADDSMGTDTESDFEFSDNDEFDYEPELEESNDYDLSWSLRANAAKIVGQMVENAPLTLKKIYSSKVFSTLVGQLTDNSTNVSNEVISTLTKIIAATSKSGSYYTIVFYNVVSSNIRKRKSQEELIAKSENDQDVEMDDDFVDNSKNLDPYDTLIVYSDQICSKIISKLITEKNIPRFNSIFSLISQLTTILNGISANHIQSLLETYHNLKLTVSIDSLRLYSKLFQSNSVSKFGLQLVTVLNNIIDATTNEYATYELSLEALNSINDFFLSINNDASISNCHDQILSLCNIFANKITSRTYSSEIKQKCLHSLSLLISNYGHIGDQPDQLIPLLKVYEDSLEYESLIEPSILELSHIVTAVSTKFDASILERILTKFVSLLELRSSDLKTVILECLSSISETQIQLPSDIKITVIHRLVVLLTKETLLGKQTSSSLNIISNLLSSLDTPSVIDTSQFLSIIDKIIPKLSSVDESALLKFVYKVSLNIADTNLFQSVSDKFERSKVKNLQYAGILAAIASALNMQDFIKSCENCIINASAQENNNLEFSISFLGYYGKNTPLDIGIEPFLNVVRTSDDANLKQIASTAIGNIASHHVAKNLPVVLLDLQNNDSLVILLRKLVDVHAEKDNVVPSVKGISSQDYDKIWDLLIGIASSKTDLKSENQILNVIADCLMCLAILDVDKMDKLIAAIDSSTAITLKYTIVSTVKYFLNYVTVLNSNTEFDKSLSKLLEKSSLLIFNENLQLKQTAVQALISSLHNKPLLTLPILSQLLSTIMEKELVTRKEYIDTIQIGPFKHKIDNALDLRKSIYEMIYTLLTTIENSNNLKTTLIQQDLNYQVILSVCIKKGLKDDYDVVQLSSIIIAKIVNLKPEILFEDDELLTAFKERSLKIINKKMKETETKQVLEKQKDSIKSVRQLISSIDKVVKKEGFHHEQLDEWRKFAFSNGFV